MNMEKKEDVSQNKSRKVGKLFLSPLLSFIILFSANLECSKKIKNPIPERCEEPRAELEKLLKLLSTFDIRDKRTRDVIKPFFKDKESLDLFIAKITYELRNKNSYYGNLYDYKIYGGRFEEKEGEGEEEKICTFDVEFSVRKKYPLGIVEGKIEISLFQENEKWYIKKPEYVGEIKERKELPIPIR